MLIELAFQEKIIYGNLAVQLDNYPYSIDLKIFHVRN